MMLLFAIGATSISAYIDAEEGDDYSANEFVDIEMVWNCREAGLENCEHIIGPVFHIRIMVEELYDPLVFPPEIEGYNYPIYPRGAINCQDPEAVSLAKYDEDSKIWNILENGVADYDSEDGGVIVTADVDGDGYYTVVPNMAEFARFDIDMEDTCNPVDCGEYSAYISNPRTGRLSNGDTLGMTFCGIVPGCTAIAGDGCDPECTPGHDPDCPPEICKRKSDCDEDEKEEGLCPYETGNCCGPKDDKCCDPTSGNGCDPDCWKEKDEYGNVIGSPDRDCLYGEGYDLLQEATLKTESFSINSISPIRASESSDFEKILFDYRLTPTEDDGWVDEGEYVEEGWKEIVFDFNEGPVVLSGPIRFEIEEEGGVWFKDFTLTNLRGEELIQFPLKIGSKNTFGRFFGGSSYYKRSEREEHRVTLPDYKDIFGEDVSYFRVGSYRDGCEHAAPYYQRNPITAFNYLLTHPTTWVMTEFDNEIEDEGYEDEDGAIIFNIPPTSVKRFHFKATRHSDKPVRVKVTYSYYDIDADADRDGWGAEEDCHDSNPTVYPGAEELCDDLDNNCNYDVVVDKRVSIPQDDYLGWNNRWDPYHYVAPCYGYLDISTVKNPAQMEIWKRNRAIMPKEDGSGNKISEVSYGKVIDSYGQYYDISTPMIESMEFDDDVEPQIKTYVVAPMDLEGDYDEENDPSYDSDFVQLKPKAIETGGWRKISPFNTFERIAKSGSHGNLYDCTGTRESGEQNRYDGPPMGCGYDASYTKTYGFCYIGSHDQCDFDLFPESCSGAHLGTTETIKSLPHMSGGYWDRYGQGLGDSPPEIDEDCLGEPVPEGEEEEEYADEDEEESDEEGELPLDEEIGERVDDFFCTEEEGLEPPVDRLEFKPGEIIWGTAQTSFRYWHSDNKHGQIHSAVYCYNNVELNDSVYGVHIDEGCLDIAKNYMYICSESSFDDETRVCGQGGELLWSGNALKGESITASYLLQDKEPGQTYSFYVFVCTDESEGTCWHFNTGSYFVCTQEEVCDAKLNIDSNCDGIRPYKPYGEEGPVLDLTEPNEGDPTKPLDLTCECPEGGCDPVHKKICIGSKWTTTDDYCTVCWDVDSSCTEEARECTEGEKSCDKGCRPGACDTSAYMVCISGGKWTTDGYESKCAPKDSEFTDIECESGSCDTEFDKTCRYVRRDAPEWTFHGEDFCTSEFSCQQRDADCTSCLPESCDTHANKYCTESGAWKSQGYCDECGAIDAGCGIKACSDGACDYGAGALCSNGNWLQLNFNDEYCRECADAPDPLSKCFCDITETDCGDGVDNDCDKKIDCNDDDCLSKDVCLPAYCSPEQEGAERKCGTSKIGKCVMGDSTCIDERWTSCEGFVDPQIEYCDGYDNDCDGAIDEDCTGCTISETRYCGAETGTCSGGVAECRAIGSEGKWGSCFGPAYITLAEEVCDGLDNDCDGLTDEGCSCTAGETQECGEDTGECQKGVQTCEAGSWGYCEGAIEAVQEVCDDSADNDCDGMIDTADDACTNTESTTGLSASCYDHIQNGDEEAIDCGGEDCIPCDQVTCEDDLWNGNEEGVDCGGPCNVCYEAGSKVTAPEEETKKKKKPAAKKEPEKKGLPWSLYAFIFVAVVVGGFLVLTVVKMKKTGKPFGETVKGMFKKPPKGGGKKPASPFAKKPAAGKPSVRPAPTKSFKPKVTKSREETALEESMKKSSEVFKKK